MGKRHEVLKDMVVVSLRALFSPVSRDSSFFSCSLLGLRMSGLARRGMKLACQYSWRYPFLEQHEDPLRFQVMSEDGERSPQTVGVHMRW